MSVTKVEYLERFIEAVDRVIAGRPGSISEDRWLVNYYDAEKLPIVSGYLDCDDERVRAETVLLLSEGSVSPASDTSAQSRGTTSSSPSFST